MKNVCLVICLFVLAAACHHKADKITVPVQDSLVPAKTDTPASYIHNFEDTALKERITNALMKLPFVIKSDRYIDSISNHQHGMAFMMDNTATPGADVDVQAGYNSSERFETYYRFFVNPKTLEIKVYDVVEDKKLTLKEYLKTQQ